MRTCQKMNCTEAATATVALRYGPKEVLVTDLRRESDRRLLELCSMHVGRLTAPVGWTLLDERRISQPSSTVGLFGNPFAPAV